MSRVDVKHSVTGLGLGSGSTALGEGKNFYHPHVSAYRYGQDVARSDLLMGAFDAPAVEPHVPVVCKALRHRPCLGEAQEPEQLVDAHRDRSGSADAHRA